jgi:hypothetical protein
MLHPFRRALFATAVSYDGHRKLKNKGNIFDLVICRCICFLKLEDTSWMCDGAGGDPLLYFKHVTQFVEAAKTHTLRMNK